VIVSELSAPKRWIAYLAGMQGGKREGISLLEAAASHAGEAQGQARYTLVLIYNRDGRYADALRILDEVRRLYPRNRQFLHEAAATWLRAGQPTQALTLLTDGIERLRTDSRPRWLGEDALWHFKRGVALRQLGRWDEAKRDFNTALSLNPRPWIAGRTQQELTRLAARDTSTTATTR
jgi:tetratricopeptide (TPR) repeat protein